MGSVRTVSATSSTTPVRTFSVRRVLDVLIALALLVLALPLMVILAVLVRQTSSGPVLRRERTRDRRGRPVEVLSFRTTIDGGHTDHHRRLRAVVGARHHSEETAIGRFMLATRTHRLPRLISILSGNASLM